LLEPGHHKNAGIIFETISRAGEIGDRKTIAETVEEIKKTIESQPGFIVEYIEIADSSSLKPINNWNDSDSIRCFAAVMAGSVRLIDNVEIRH
jgi:pantothenate synthetase